MPTNHPGTLTDTEIQKMDLDLLISHVCITMGRLRNHAHPSYRDWVQDSIALQWELEKRFDI